MDPKYKETIIVNAGESFKIDADVYGKPLPTIHWLKGDHELANTAHLEIKSTNFATSLSVKEAIRVDSGHYVLLAKNVAGEKTASVHVKVLDRPGPPEGPVDITGVTAEKCVLAWKPPLQDGGSNISHYIVERRETSRLVWTVVDSNVQTLSCKVTKLLEGNEYVFRIMAVNKYGVGEPLESEPVIAKNPFVVPLPPNAPEVSAITKDSMIVVWERPASDGGSEILGYVLEKRDKEGIRWTRCNKRLVSELRYRVTGLIENHDYEYRVSAENAAGLSEPSLPSTYYKACDPIYKPGPPNNPKAIDVTRSSVFLSWGKPIYDGGSEIQGYIVEKCDVSVGDWTICTPPTGIKKTNMEVENVLEKHEYKFRICAVNKAGVGEHADVPGTVIVEEKLEAPDLDLDLDLRKIVNVRAGGSLRLFVPIRGRPTPEVKWGKMDGEIREAAIIDITSSFTSLVLDNVNRFDTGKYTLTLENSSGIKSAFVSVRVLDTPSPPVNLKIKEITKDSVSLSWEPPLLDGGAKIKNYIVEKREATRKAYAAVATNCHKTSWKLPRISMDPKYKDTIVVNAGEMFKLEADVHGKPLPTIKWFKGDKELEETFTVTKLKENNEYNFRICAINSEGVGEPATIPGTVIAADKIEPPEIELDADLRKVVTVRASGTLRLFVTIKGRPEPEVKWEKAEGTISDRAQIEVTSSYTMLVIDNVNRFDSGRYNLTLENNSGKKSAFVNVRVLDSPSAPVNLTIREVKRDSVALAWEPPLIDGGAKITNYIIEKRESTRKAYATVTNNCTKNTFKIDQLQEGCIYYFRVLAANEYGVGLPAETAEPVKVSEPPYPPGKVTLVDVTRNTATITWEKPESDGGSKITGYIVEMQTKGSEKWSTCTQVKTLEATITGLSKGEEYTFRVIAVNEKGKSDPRQLGVPVVAKDIEIQPSAELLFNTFSVKAGDELKIDVPIRGRPPPTASWRKDGQTLKETTRVNVQTSKTSTLLTIKEASKEDVGNYELCISNSAGSTTFSITVIVLDRPGPPCDVHIDSVSADNVTLSWKAPGYDGGCHISNYIKTDETDWSIAIQNLRGTEYTVIGLTSGSEYVFRVRSINKVGASDPSDVSEPQVAKEREEEPAFDIDSEMRKTLIVKAGESFTMTVPFRGKPVPNVMWNKPETDLRTRASIDSSDYCTSLTIEKATRNDSGKYALTLQNVLSTATLTLVVKVLDSPGPPSNIAVKDVTKESAVLSWDVPENDGGAPVKNYYIEKREASKKAWVTITNNCHRLSYKVTSLQEGAVYYFRVSGENEFGIGVPTETKEGVKITGLSQQ
uniref:Titin n=1 Tax=Chrysemys picta bellii TaxID=8478 RepID=A0A8C3F8A2_CHRPI